MWYHSYNVFFREAKSIRTVICEMDEQGLVLKSQQGVVRLSFDELEYVEVINKTVSVHLVDGAVYEVNASLAVFEAELLTRPEFIKTHRSYLVNMNYIRVIDTGFAVTKNGNNIPASRQRRNRVQDAYKYFGRQTGPWRILLVDDDVSDRTFWADVLRRHGCVVWMAGKGEEALRLVEEETFDCVLMDAMMPGEDGFAICEKIRKRLSVPVIFLSCLTETDRQMDGFAAGGIDYITKDTPAELFWTKVETRIRLAVCGRTQLHYGPLLLDLVERKAMMGGEELSLTSAEFDILWCLSEHAGRIYTPEEIFTMVWGNQSFDDGQTVQRHMSRLRRKLEKAWEEHSFIETVWGQGYRFVLPDSPPLCPQIKIISFQIPNRGIGADEIFHYVDVLFFH